MAFQVPYIYGYITKLCRQQAEVIQSHENANVRDIETGEARHRKYNRLCLAAMGDDDTQKDRKIGRRSQKPTLGKQAKNKV
jgi:hypothetical protein